MVLKKRTDDENAVKGKIVRLPEDKPSNIEKAVIKASRKKLERARQSKKIY